MALKRTHRPRDPIQLGKLMVDIATGAVPDSIDDTRRGQSGGVKGGAARAAKLTPEQRAEIARAGASARWGKG